MSCTLGATVSTVNVRVTGSLTASSPSNACTVNVCPPSVELRGDGGRRACVLVAVELAAERAARRRGEAEGGDVGASRVVRPGELHDLDLIRAGVALRALRPRELALVGARARAGLADRVAAEPEPQHVGLAARVHERGAELRVRAAPVAHAGPQTAERHEVAAVAHRADRAAGVEQRAAARAAAPQTFTVAVARDRHARQRPRPPPVTPAPESAIVLSLAVSVPSLTMPPGCRRRGCASSVSAPWLTIAAGRADAVERERAGVEHAAADRHVRDRGRRRPRRSVRRRRTTVVVRALAPVIVTPAGTVSSPSSSA